MDLPGTGLVPGGTDLRADSPFGTPRDIRNMRRVPLCGRPVPRPPSGWGSPSALPAGAVWWPRVPDRRRRPGRSSGPRPGRSSIGRGAVFATPRLLAGDPGGRRADRHRACGNAAGWRHPDPHRVTAVFACADLRKAVNQCPRAASDAFAGVASYSRGEHKLTPADATEAIHPNTLGDGGGDREWHGRKPGGVGGEPAREVSCRPLPRPLPRPRARRSSSDRPVRRPGPGGSVRNTPRTRRLP